MCSRRGCGQVPSDFPTQLWKCSSGLICSSLAVPVPGSHTALAAGGYFGPRRSARAAALLPPVFPKLIRRASTPFDSQPSEARLETEEGGGENVCYFSRFPVPFVTPAPPPVAVRAPPGESHTSALAL